MDNLVSQGAPLALFGIGIVFAFLCVLVCAVRVMSILTARPGPPGVLPEEQVDYPVPPAQLAAIVAAIGMHRARRSASGPHDVKRIQP